MCIVFTQPIYRKSPCAMYFLAASISQFLTYNFALFTRMIQYGYDVQTLNYNLWYCKIRFYLFYIFVAIPRYNIILASIDRYFSSSRDVHRRQRSSMKTSFRLIIGNVIFWCLMYIQVIVFYEISTGNCTFQSGVYGIFFSIYIAIESGTLPLLLMLIFGLLTVRNIRQTKQRVDIGANQRTKISKKDLQLHRMLANQIVLFIILNMPNPIFLVYRSITLQDAKSSLRRAGESFASNMTYVLIYLGFSLTFVNFMISSDIFRRELMQLIRTKILRRPPVVRTTGGGGVGGTTIRVVRPNDIDE
ncbi:hypothetical protein I4U23_005879 [Adineta vaga]|nr:hypothetical protein I4U23_005879 [Adineta vaga]